MDVTCKKHVGEQDGVMEEAVDNSSYQGRVDTTNQKKRRVMSYYHEHSDENEIIGPSVPIRLSPSEQPMWLELATLSHTSHVGRGGKLDDGGHIQ